MSAPDGVTTTHPEPLPAPDAGDDGLFGEPRRVAVGDPTSARATRSPAPPGPGDGGPDRGVDYAAIQDSPEFQELRRRTLRFVVPATVLFMANYMLFVLLSAYAPDVMATPAIGLVNVGIIIGVFQFVTTVVLVTAYDRFARRHTDPLAERVRAEAEGA